MSHQPLSHSNNFEMSNLEPPPPSTPTELLPSANFQPEKPPENEIPGPSTNTTTICEPSSTEHKQEDTDRHAKIMENFKGIIFKFAVSSSPTKSLSPLQRSLIEKRLDEVFPSFRTPDHPPYTAMIDAAVKELAKDGASSEDGISHFLRKEYPDLPWAHDNLLKYHLGNLCKNGSIIKTSNGLYMLRSEVPNQDSASALPPSPCFSIDAYSDFSLSPDCTLSSSSSDRSYCSTPRPKRKRQMYTRRRKKCRRRTGSMNKRVNKERVNCTRGVRGAKRRRGRPLKQDVSEDETEVSDECLMLEDSSEETEAGHESEEESSEEAEGINQVRGKRQRIRKQDQRQENGLMIEIQLDNHEDMVDEGPRELKTRGLRGRKAHPKSRHVPGRRRGRARRELLFVEKTQPCMEEMKTDIQYPMNMEVPEEKYRIDKELADLVEDQNQVQGNMYEPLESSSVEDIHIVKKIGEPESVGELNKPIQPCVTKVMPKEQKGVEECDERKSHDNFEGIEEQSQLEEYNMVPYQDHNNGKKRRGRPPKSSVKGRKVQLKPKCVPGRPRGRPRKKDLSVEKTQRNEEQMDTTNNQNPVSEVKTEVSAKKCDTNKEVSEVVERHNKSQGNLCETLQRNPAEEIVKEIEKSWLEEKKLMKQFNLVMERELESEEATKSSDRQREHEMFLGSEGKTQFEEPYTVPNQYQRIQQKRRGRGRPVKKDILVEKTQASAEHTERTDIHESKFIEDTEMPNENCGINKESTKVVMDCCEFKGNMRGTSERSPVDKTKIVKEVRKPGPVAEENLPIEQDCFMMVGEKQRDCGIKGFSEQKEFEDAFDEEKSQSAKENNEKAFGESQPKRQEHEEQNQQLEKGLKSVTESKVEVLEMIGQDSQIQDNIHSGGQYESITETLQPVDVAERSMDCKAVVFPEESFDSVLKEGKGISNESMEQQREIRREEKPLEIDGRQTEFIEQQPESSTAGNFQLKSVERTSQPHYLLQQKLEEKPVDGQIQLCSHSSKSYNLCRVL